VTIYQQIKYMIITFLISWRWF